MPVTEEQNDYAKLVCRKLKLAGIRAETDLRNEKVGYKVREHSLKKVPVQLVVGKKEEAENTVTIRRLGSDKQTVMSLNEAISLFKQEGRFPSLEYED